MKAVILAGGLGTRISEETNIKPKPMVEVGGMPILWHIMKLYSHYGINEFIICCGYKGYIIKEFFSNYFLHSSDVTFDLKSNTTSYHKSKTEPWKVTLIDTGEQTMTGGRIKKIEKYLDANEDFCLTYGDGVSDINIPSLLKFHNDSKKLATVTAVVPPGRFGSLELSDKNIVRSFIEKPLGDGAYINGGFFVLNKKALDFIGDDSDLILWEKEPLQKLANNNQLAAYKHNGFWQPMDTLREKNILEELWVSGKAPWKIWNE
jgi:glucose-1-phosphate cytidylyltransferase